jgi:broad specificity phosphatase PhoE
LVTLIRHGQAGSRVVYDDLSEAGREQSRALGAWFGERGVRFDTIVVGGLTRQRLTAEEVIATMGGAPELAVDARWSEFDLELVYAGIGPRLACEDEQFRSEYEQLQREIADPESSSHRAWRHCDVTVVRAWIEARFEFEGESFSAFGDRVRAALSALPQDRSVAVVTSATPIAVCAAMALDLAPRRVMQLAAALRNTALSEMDLRSRDPRLISFNNVAHLREERLRTLR